MIAPTHWSDDELEQERQVAIDLFRTQRLGELPEAYSEKFEEYQGAVEELLEATVDLHHLEERLLEVLLDKRRLEAFRSLAGPPVSEDDLKTIARASLAMRDLKSDADMRARVLEVVRSGLDRGRFPWLTEDRDPTETELHAARVATAALMATRWAQTARRSEGKIAQEAEIAAALRSIGLHQVAARKIETLAQAPRPGEFCAESLLTDEKADFVVGLWDTRVMPIEAKVSNSATNSVKRLNREAAGKASAWRERLGSTQVIPAAVLSGVYKLRNLRSAQTRGLTLYWAHKLAALTDWIEATRR